MRSKLFVPGTRPDRFDKALAAGADAVSFDLEDAVPAERKAEARAAVAGWLQGAGAAAASAQLIVRINPLGSPHWQADVAALVGSAAGWLNLPKVEGPDEVRALCAQIDRHAAARGDRPPLKLLCNIETPRGLRHAAEIAQADGRVGGLQLGLGDLFEPAGIRRDQPASVHAAMFALRLAAAEAGVPALDGAWPGPDDEAGFVAEARLAQGLGFAGKSCIHPRQVAWAHAVFGPSAAQLAQARRIVAAAEAAAARGEAVCVVDGRMVDAPYLQSARALLQAGAALSSPR